jgi:hypothetical protein
MKAKTFSHGLQGCSRMKANLGEIILVDKGVTMLALKGVYDHGKVSFSRPLKINKPVEVIVTFLQPFEENSPALDLKRFSFDKSRQLLSQFTGELSAVVVDDRRVAI